MAGKIYFLDAKNWENYGFINSNIDTNKLKPIILRTQKLRIEPILGTTLFDKLQADVEGASVSGIYKTLLDDYVLDCLIAYCDWSYSFHGRNQMTNKTVGANNDQYISSNPVSENNDLRDQLIKEAKQFERKLIGWLQDNRTDIPEYCNTEADKCHQSIKPSTNDGDYMGSILIA